MKTPDEADSTEPVLVISLTASERSTDARACPWTRVEPCVTGLVASFQTLDEQAQPVRLGVETVGRAFYSIEDTIFAKYSERYSLRRPSELFRWSDGARNSNSNSNKPPEAAYT